MVRLNAIQRSQDIPEAISQYCTDTDQLDTAAHYRIIISTCSTAGQLYSLGLRAGHITHVFVDEVCCTSKQERPFSRSNECVFICEIAPKNLFSGYFAIS